MSKKKIADQVRTFIIITVNVSTHKYAKLVMNQMKEKNDFKKS